jgi:tripartite-type tricarboxylate transporter receptor subunit TctC
MGHAAVRPGRNEPVPDMEHWPKNWEEFVTIQRRHFLRLSGGAVAMPFVSRFARADAYPSRVVRLVVGFPAGSSMDVVARLLGQWLSERLGQQFIVENRTGAGSNLAMQAVVNAAPDGYTLAVVGTNNTINTTLYEKLSFNFSRDIIPVSSLIRTPCVMAVNPSVPTQTVSEFIAYAKANPGKINMASGGIGTVTHVSGELFKMMAGVDLVHVPYRGSPPALTDLVGGQMQVMFDTVPTSLALIKGGKLRPLAVTAPARLASLPDVPPLSESLPGYETSFWLGVGAPKGTPPDIIQTLNREITAGLGNDKVASKLVDMGAIVMPMTAEQFGQLIATDTEKWRKVVQFAGLKAE